MGAQTRTYWKNGVLNYYDEILNPAFRVGLWTDCPLLAIRADPSIGIEIFEDFTNIDAATFAGYTATQAGAAGTFAIGATVGGIGTLNAGHTDAGDGINVQKLGPCIIPAANKDIWFECSLSATNPTKLQFFAGLAQVDNTLNPAGDLDKTNSEYIGFGIETGLAAVMSFYECKATAELSDSLGATGTLAAATSIRLGFKVTGITGIECYINGAKIALTNVVYGGIPVTAVMTPSFVCQSDGVSQPVVSLDWYRVVQLR